LYLSGNSLSGDLPGSFSKLISLREVDLSNNDYAGEFPKVLTSLKLNYFNIGHNSFKGELPDDFSKWKSMTEFYVNDNEFSGKIKSSLTSFRSALVIDLSGNEFSGKLPYQLYFLKGLYVFDASNNNLTGKLSKRFSKMTGLLDLSLNNNQFEGSIPKEFGNKSWDLLYLQNNNLSGCYDDNLKKLCNQFGIFDFTGNPGLPNNGQFSGFCSSDIGNCEKLPGCSDGFVTLTGGGDSLSYKSPITWLPAENAEGYRVSIGTVSKGIDIADNVDVGNSNSYDAGELPLSKRIYVNIVPYNKYGKSSDCDELSFVAVKTSSVFESDTINFGSFVNMYPVPAKDYISIKKVSDNVGKIKMDIINIDGVKVLDETIKNGEIIKKVSLESLSKGVYFIKMKIKSKEYSKKLIIL